jgi:hypothetical protein
MELYSIFIDGLIVPEYCVEHNIPFDDVLKRFRRMRPNTKIKDWTDSALVKYIIVMFHKKKNKSDKVKYLSSDDEIFEEARKNKIMAANVRGAINRGLKKNPNASPEELATSYIERTKHRIVYTCDQRPLEKVCFDLGIRAEAVRSIFRDLYPEDVRYNMTKEELDDAVKVIVYDVAVNTAYKSKK